MENIPTAYGVEVAYPGHEEELLSQGFMEACVSVSATLCQVTPILIVDDDPDIREALSDRLVLEGYTAQAVGTGGEAIQKVRHERYGAVLLDIGLPDINGLSVLKILTELDSKLPVIVITAQTTEENKVGSLRKGAFAYLAKPFNLEEVRATVRRAVAGKALAVKAEDVEHAWRESEERFRCVVESATDAIVLADAGGNIISWNRAAEGLFGYAEHEVMGQPLTILMPLRYREAHQRGLERVASTADSRMTGRTVELHGQKKDGREFPLELSIATWQSKSGRFYSGIIRDITARKRAEHRLMAEHAVARILAEAPTLPVATRMILKELCQTLAWDLGMVWYVDRQADVLRCSQIWHRTPSCIEKFEALSREITFSRGVGLPGRVWADGTPAWIPDVVHDGNFPRASAAAREGLHAAICFPILAGAEVLGVIEFFSHEIQPPDEQLVLMFAAIGNQLGQFIERKRAEDALHESQERFRQLAENIQEVFWMTDPEKNQMIYISPAYEEVWGRSCESLYASPLSWLETIHPEDRARVLSSAVTRQVSGNYDEEYRIIRADGNVRWIKDRAFPVPDDFGMIYRIAGIAEDITDRKVAEEALRKAYGETEKILASLPASIIIVENDERVVYANHLVEQDFEIAHEAVVGNLIHEILPLTASQWHRLVDEFNTAMMPDGTSTYDGEFETKKRVFRYRLFPVAIRGSERKQIGLVIWDITEQKQLQDQLIQAEKLASLGTMVSGMAHEINNPMQGILGMAQIILKEKEPEKILEYAHDIVDFSRHAATVVRDFASYARSSSRDGEVDVDLAERLREAVKLVQLNPQFGDVEVITKLETMPPFRARRAEIDQMCVNIISNAVQAMKGSGRLTLATSAQGETLTVLISDSGPGIPKAVIGKIFDPFFTTKDPGKGTGLGLSIVHTLVVKYRGRISVESQEGVGTTFSIQFPLAVSSTEASHGNA